MSEIFDRILLKLVYTFFKKRTYVIHTKGNKYLLRVYLKHKGIFPEIFLHKFYASDSDRDLHNHPWKWATSFVLMGGYSELKFNKDKTVKLYHQKMAPTINRIKDTEYHQVSLLKSPIWTLFIAGPRTQEWGFWDEQKKVHVPWQEYVDLNGNFVTDLDGNLTKLPAEK